MTETSTYRVCFRLFLLLFLSLSLWALSGSALNARRDEKYIPVNIARQLRTENGGISVEIRCSAAHLTAANELAGFTCTLKNNTAKNIVAANATYAISVERNGVTTQDTFNSFVETFSDPEFNGASRRIGQGEEFSVGPPGPISYADGIITGVEIEIDYIEFGDKTTLGPNKNGSAIIKDFREGARQYKQWLNRKFHEHGKSLPAILSLLEDNSSLPHELDSLTPDQTLGATSYRNRIRSIYRKRGAVEAERLLN